LLKDQGLSKQLEAYQENGWRILGQLLHDTMNLNTKQFMERHPNESSSKFVSKKLCQKINQNVLKSSVANWKVKTCGCGEEQG
jgi:hypothetical protein